MRWSLLLVAVLFVSILCAGCGGSDSSSTAPARPAPSVSLTPAPSVGSLTPLVQNSNVNVYGQSTALVGESVGFAAASKIGNVRASWQQTGGPSVQILAKNSMAMGFDAPTAGDYSFVLSVTSESGISEQINVDLSVANDQDIALNIRLDHSVTELAKVSLSADINPSKTLDGLRWRQTAGPQIADLTEQGNMVFFDAPSVNEDAVIQLEATAQYSDGSNETDTVLIAVRNVNFDQNGLFFSNNIIITEDMHAYNPDSPYKNAIERCVYNNQIPGRPDCTFATLPLIGSVNSNPTVQDILDRTLVSHAWMGDNFKNYLENSAAGEDMLRLLRGVTAVVISYDVRPSFYWAATGAIYLDANNFWQTPLERDTLNDQPDFRSDFGNDLNFSVFWRYTKNNDYYPAGRYPKSERENRDFADLEASISWLMYHELAHANDFFPPTVWQNISSGTTPLAYFQNNGTNSDTLDQLYPLRSDELHALASVSFGGQTPSSQQRNFRGTDIEGFFSPDIASSYYSYYTTREDFATLAERFMMLYRLGAEADIAIIDGQTSDDFNVIWGQRNRISETALRERTAFAVSRVYPELGNIAELQSALPPARLMNPANGWFGNLNLSPGTNSVPTQQREFNLKQRAIEDQRQPHLAKPNVNEH